MEMREGICPKCGWTLHVPEELKEFSCLYCGARLTPGELLSEQPKAESTEEDYQLYVEKSLHAAVDWPDSMGRVTKTEFFSYFDRYYGECAAPFEALERWVLAQTGDREMLLQKAAALLMDGIEAWFPTQKGWKLRSRRTELIERTKFTVAIFLVPTARKCAPIIGDGFCEKLRLAWLEKHPDSPFELASYQELADGFKKRPFCFITTAVCEFRGESDDCAMLTEFRAFRDGYLRSCPDGDRLIEEYYDIAPGIVARIDFCENRAEVYDALYRDYLVPCRQALRDNDPSACKAIYTSMLRSLHRQ